MAGLLWYIHKAYSPPPLRPSLAKIIASGQLPIKPNRYVCHPYKWTPRQLIIPVAANPTWPLQPSIIMDQFRGTPSCKCINCYKGPVPHVSYPVIMGCTGDQGRDTPMLRPIQCCTQLRSLKVWIEWNCVNQSFSQWHLLYHSLPILNSGSPEKIHFIYVTNKYNSRLLNCYITK